MLTLAISAEARRELQSALAKQGAEGSWVRIASSQDACGGLCYELEVVERPQPGDVMLQESGLQFAVEPGTASRLGNARLDYVVTPRGRGYAFRNTGGTCSPDTCTCE